MGAEKAAAFSESWNAMTVQALRANQALAASFFRAFWSPSLKGRPSASAVAAQWQNAALGVLDKAWPRASDSKSQTPSVWRAPSSGNRA